MRTLVGRLIAAGCLIASVYSAALTSTFAQDLIVSANDGHLVRVEGRVTFPNPPPAPDSLIVLDASTVPPRVKAVVEDGLQYTMQGPPQSVAITPDGLLAFVGTPERYDYVERKSLFLTFLQVVDLEANPPRLSDRIELGSHPAGLSVSPDGKILLASLLDGQVAVLAIEGKKLSLVDRIKVSSRRLSSVTFTRDGKSALVGLRDEQGLTVLSIDDGKVSWTKERVTTGISPYSIDISADGHWAVVSCPGLVAVNGESGKLAADADVVTVVDTSKRPFRAVDHIAVPAIPEAAAISPDGHWIAVQSMAGSTFPSDHPHYRKVGKVSLYSLGPDGKARAINELDGGHGAQGLVFAKDSRTLFVQFQVEKALAVYSVSDGKLVDTGERIRTAAGPGSIRSTPR